ncbi:MAG: hypothetical protein K8F57_03735, partial [Alphaproteobacteria bacterium]|nr:hypothetical protein [Alphaproteobacteria bacterium]
EECYLIVVKSTSQYNCEGQGGQPVHPAPTFAAGRTDPRRPRRRRKRKRRRRIGGASWEEP